jgi:hypothetical protein
MRRIIFGLIFILTIALLWVNFKLFTENFTTAEKQNDIVRQLNFLGTELRANNLGNRMQEIFPEGFVFTNALYGLSWCELAIADPTRDSKLRSRALNEALFAYHEIDTDEAKSIFDSQLTPEYGVFYAGWKNYLLAKILELDTAFANYDKYRDAFTKQCEAISLATKQSDSPYLPSYHGQTWPADMFVAMASIKRHDHLFKPKYESEISDWIKNVKSKLGSPTKMIPHKVNSRTAATLEGERGSSASLIIRFLAEIDADFAKEQYELYKTYFVTTTFGLPSISEYPKGKSGEGDIDSGPVIFGVGFSGTIVSIGTFSKLGDLELAENQYKTINAFGFATKPENEKKYIFGVLPIADAFIAWGRATCLNNKMSANPSSTAWRIKFQLISLTLLMLLWSLFFLKRILMNWKNRG